MEKVFKFLSALKKNNNREWFEEHKDQYLQSKAEFEELVEKLIAGIAKFDKEIGINTKAKDCVFRIYKDVRFSKDKTPYKTNMGASINPGGKKSPTPGYYFQIEPGNCFIAGGVWGPQPEHLNAIRQEIDYNGDALLKIMKSKPFSSYYSGLDDIDTLKTVPKGYEKDNKYIDLLKHRHFIVSFEMKDKDLLNPKNIGAIIDACKAMHPFLVYLRNAIAK